MAAYAMTELDGKEEEGGGGGGDGEAEKETQGSTTVTAPVEEGVMSSMKESSEMEPQVPTTDGSVSHGFGPSPTKEIVPVNHAPESSNPPEAAASTNESNPQQHQDQPPSIQPNETTFQPIPEQQQPLDTNPPSIEERLSAEVSPDHTDEKPRKKRPHPSSSTDEEEAPPSSFHPPSRPPPSSSSSSNTKEKNNLFRNPSSSSDVNGEVEVDGGDISCPVERNVSADSDDNGDGRVKEPPVKKAAVESTQ